MRCALIAVLCFSLTEASAAPFAIKDTHDAVAFAKKLCRHVAKSSLVWNAGLDNGGKTWAVTTMPSIRKCGDPLFLVKIPVNGPLPQRCERVPYLSVLCTRPKKADMARPAPPPVVPVVPVPHRPIARKRNA